MPGRSSSIPTAQLTATTFVPRRVLYELRAGRDYFKAKERCVFCDIIAQEDAAGPARDRSCGATSSRCVRTRRACPTKPGSCRASTRPPSSASGLARPASMRDLAACLRRTLQRIRTMTEEFHLVLHTSPNTLHRSKQPGLLEDASTTTTTGTSRSCPILGAKAKSYTFKEVYYSPVTSETAVKATARRQNRFLIERIASRSTTAGLFPWLAKQKQMRRWFRQPQKYRCAML